jgi:hypothetical protein
MLPPLLLTWLFGGQIFFFSTVGGVETGTEHSWNAIGSLNPLASGTPHPSSHKLGEASEAPAAPENLWAPVQVFSVGLWAGPGS